MWGVTCTCWGCYACGNVVQTLLITMEHHAPSFCGGQDDVTQQWWSGEVRHPSLEHSMYHCSVEEGWSPPPSTVARVSSQQIWVGSIRRDGEYLQRGCGKRAGSQVSSWWCRRKRELYMKTRGLTTHPKRPTNLFSPCCGQLSTRSPSPTSTAECSGPESLTIKPTVWLF